jgi:hypothetical protein
MMAYQHSVCGKTIMPLYKEQQYYTARSMSEPTRPKQQPANQLGFTMFCQLVSQLQPFQATKASTNHIAAT